jgi:hypothetical protein
MIRLQKRPACPKLQLSLVSPDPAPASKGINLHESVERSSPFARALVCCFATEIREIRRSGDGRKYPQRNRSSELR